MAFILSRAEQQILHLDHRLQLIRSATDPDIIHEVFSLMELVTKEYILATALNDLAREFNTMVEEYKNAEQKLMAEAFGLLDELYLLEPSLVKPDIANANPTSMLHEYSLMAVEEIRQGKRSSQLKTAVDSDKDHTDGSVVFKGILNSINANSILRAKYEANDEAVNEKVLGIQQAASERNTAFKLLTGRRKVHPFEGYRLLHRFHATAYPKYPRASTWHEYVRWQVSPSTYDWSRVDAALKGEGTDEFIALLRRCAERLIYGLQDTLRGTASMLELIQRFRIRAMWYDKPRLRQLAGELLPGKKNNLLEDKLTKELAVYLFDNGYPVLIKADIENVQLDALGLDVPVLVEAKAYKDGTQRAAVLSGMSQLHAYMNLMEGSKLHVEEAFYVVFRLGGPLYELPSVIRTNRFTIYPVVVDIAESNVSGRKQPKPVVITREMIFPDDGTSLAGEH